MNKNNISRIYIYRKYEEDIWGTFFLIKPKRIMRVLKLMHLSLIENNFKFRKRFKLRMGYVYKFALDDAEPPRKRKFYMPHVAYKRNLRKLRFFYGVLNEKNFKYYILRSRFNSIRLINLFLINFENRTDVILMRLNLFNSVFEIRQLLKHRKIYINNKLITFGDVKLKKNDYISFSYKITKLLLKKYLKLRHFIFPIPYYIEWDFRMLLFLITTPLINLKKKATGLYYPKNITKASLHLA